MIKIGSYKRLSIKFGIVCGMVVTLCGAVNAVLGSIQKWNETFEKSTELSASFDQPTEGWVLEQRIEGEVPAGTTITKGITIPEESNNDIEEPDISSENPDFLSSNSWIIVMLIGGGMVWFLMREHKKDTLYIKDDKEPDNIV